MKVKKKPVVLMAKQATKNGRIKTLEGTMYYRKGDYILTGTQGERWSVKKKFLKKHMRF